ncbi:MAG: phosphatase PAP2 family protein [Candidatus Cloacimonetes bacterium]|nr:phosphatase PAP2 family protein [Candidatus Cloacimonadota bacterium]
MKRKIFCCVVLFFILFNFLYADEWKLSYKTDIPIIISAFGLDLSADSYKRTIDGLSEDQIKELDKNEIFVLDRFAADLYDLKLKKASDYTVYTNFLIPIGTSLLIDKENFISDMIIYGETMYLQAGIAKWCKFLTKRNRPYTYNDQADSSRQDNRDARFSFVSMHTTTAFSAAVFGSYLYQERGGQYPTLFWIANLSLAAATGILRVASGNHFPTDIICGAIIGSAFGYLIPALHKVKDSKVSFNFTGNSIFLSMKI